MVCSRTILILRGFVLREIPSEGLRAGYTADVIHGFISVQRVYEIVIRECKDTIVAHY